MNTNVLRAMSIRCYRIVCVKICITLRANALTLFRASSPAASFASMVMKMASVAWSRKRFLFRASPVPADAGVQDEWEGQRESHGLQRQEGQEEFTKGDDHDDNGEEDEPPMVQIHCSFVSVWVVRSEGSKDGRNNTVITIFDSGNQEADNLQLQVSVSDLSPSKTMEKSRRSRDLMTSWGSFKGVQHVKDRTILHASTRGRRDIKGSKRNICNINRTCSCTCANGGCPPAEVDDIFDEIRQELRLSNTRLRENAPESLFYAVVAKTVEVFSQLNAFQMELRASLKLHPLEVSANENGFIHGRNCCPSAVRGWIVFTISRPSSIRMISGGCDRTCQRFLPPVVCRCRRGAILTHPCNM